MVVLRTNNEMYHTSRREVLPANPVPVGPGGAPAAFFATLLQTCFLDAGRSGKRESKQIIKAS
jgi:hypothetical protein